jgi:hypothetical protein
LMHILGKEDEAIGVISGEVWVFPCQSERF